jgi:hypothetical protein
VRAEEPAPPFKPHTACIDFAGSPQHGPPYRPKGIPAGATEEAAAGLGGTSPTPLPGLARHARSPAQSYTGGGSIRCHSRAGRAIKPQSVYFFGGDPASGVCEGRSSAGTVGGDPTLLCTRAWTARRARQTRFDRTRGQSASRQRGQRAVSEGSEPSARAAGPQPASACVSCCLRITSH